MSRLYRQMSKNASKQDVSIRQYTFGAREVTSKELRREKQSAGRFNSRRTAEDSCDQAPRPFERLRFWNSGSVRRLRTHEERARRSDLSAPYGTSTSHGRSVLFASSRLGV